MSKFSEINSRKHFSGSAIILVPTVIRQQFITDQISHLGGHFGPQQKMLRHPHLLLRQALPPCPLFSMNIDPPRPVSEPSSLRGLPKAWFPKGWFWRMFPWNENRNEERFGCSPGTTTGTRVRSHVPRERKPERGRIRQNRPFRKPPFSEDFSLLVTFLLVTFSWPSSAWKNSVWAYFVVFFVVFSWLFRGPRFGQILRVLALEKSSELSSPSDPFLRPSKQKNIRNVHPGMGLSHECPSFSWGCPSAHA